MVVYGENVFWSQGDFCCKIATGHREKLKARLSVLSRFCNKSMEPRPFVNINGSFYGKENTVILIFRQLYTNENMQMNIIFHFCHILPIDSNKCYSLDKCL